MTLRSSFRAVVALAISGVSAGAQWDLRPSGTQASLRGLHVVDEQVVWASGERGTVLRTTDGGSSWQLVSIPGADSFDVRAIHARSALVAHAAATAGRIWRTTDGGRTWAGVYRATDTSAFLDAIAFSDDRRGMVLGDPIGGRFLLLVTENGGDDWRETPADERPAARGGEAAFAASGSSLVLSGSDRTWIGTGGSVARVLWSADGGQTWSSSETPLAQGKPSAGVFSLAFTDAGFGIAVGGDYLLPDTARGNAAFTTDRGRTWAAAVSPPRGYRSGVAMYAGTGRVLAIAVGTSGADYSSDGGRTWEWIDSTGFNAVQVSPGGTAFAVGGGGRVARLDLERVAARRRQE